MSYRQVDLIEVLAWGERVGALLADPRLRAYAFEYDEAWRDGQIELSPLRMPLADRVYAFPELSEATFHGLPAMIADSLPDRFGNALVTAKLADEGITPDQITPLDRLAYAADRAMGALEYRPPLPKSEPRAIMVQLADLVVAARAAFRGDFGGDHTAQESLRELIQVGTSAGGARAKAVISYNSETQQIRSGQLEGPPGFEQWLLKLDGIDETEQLGASRGFGRIEYAYHLMATRAGIDMTECRLFREGDRAHFMTKRFDRTAGGGPKVHAQTLCAIDHLDFNIPDAHSYGQYLQVIDRLGLGPAARDQAFRRAAFNVAAANRDDHTKNLSFLCDRFGAWSLAPAYDVTHAHSPSGGWTQRHQMSVNGKFEGITRSDLLTLAHQFDVADASVVLDEVLGAVDQWGDVASDAGVSDRDRVRVQTDLDAFRPA